MPVTRRIFLQGNSLVITLPAHILAEVGAEQGDYLALDVVGQKWIVLTLVNKNKSLKGSGHNNRDPTVH